MLTLKKCSIYVIIKKGGEKMYNGIKKIENVIDYIEANLMGEPDYEKMAKIMKKWFLSQVLPCLYSLIA